MSRMPEFHLQVLAGLCNRLRALISGICLAEEYQIPLIVHWSVNHACGTVFENLFDPSSLPSFVSINPLPLIKAYHVVSDKDIDFVRKTWDKKKPLVLKSYAHFYTEDTVRWNKWFRQLKPKQEILDEVLGRLSPFVAKPLLGVHIRRTDHVHCIAQSPLQDFIERLDKTDSFLILATDDMDVRNELEKRYKGRIFFPSQVLDRYTKIGMREALIDFLSLSRCAKILGSRGSSFSEMAAMYGGCSLEYVKG